MTSGSSLKLYAVDDDDSDGGDEISARLLHVRRIIPPCNFSLLKYKVEAPFSGRSERHMCEPVLTLTSNPFVKTPTVLLVHINLVVTKL